MEGKGEISGLILLSLAASEEATQSAASCEIGAELANNEDALVSSFLVQQKHRIPTELEMRRAKRRRQCSSNNKNAKLMDLPSDILIHDIILRLPVNSLCRIRCVSKLLKNIVDNPNFVTNHMRRLLTTTNNFAQLPLLMLLGKSPLNHPEFGFFFNFKALHSLEYDGNGNALKQRKHAIISEILTSLRIKYNVHFVFCNLVCFKDIKYGGRCFLFNPLMGEVLMLPTSNVQVLAYRRGLELADWFAMGFDDMTSTYKILRVSGNPSYKNLVAQVLVLGTSTWREISSVPPCTLSHKNVSAYGDMHWVISNSTRSRGSGETSNIISFDFKKEQFYWTPHPPLQSKGSRLGYLNLLNLRGCLAVVDACSDIQIDIWVLKNYDNKEWERQYCINTEFARYVRIHGYAMERCGEWEHGIFFKDSICSHRIENNSTAIFFDLSGCPVSAKLVECPILVQNWTIISYTGSLISLKIYGKLKQKLLGVCADLRQID